MIQRTLADLQQETEMLGLEVIPEGKKLKKEDYIRELRNYYLTQKYGNNVPKDLELMLELKTPMVAGLFQNLKKDQMEEVLSSGRYFAEEKLDGVRGILMFLDTKFYVYSRHSSVKDYLPISYSDKIYLPDVDFSKIKDNFILDSEIVCTTNNISTVMGNRGVVTETQLQAVAALLAINVEDSIRLQKEYDLPLVFYTFDCLYWNGTWLLDFPLIERRKYLKQAIKELKEAGFPYRIPQYQVLKQGDLMEFADSLIAQGKEGVIFKDIKGTYENNDSRSHRKWIKYKRSTANLFSSLSGDTIDGWISGYEISDRGAWKGLVGSLDISINLLDEDTGEVTEHVIARVTNIDFDFRKRITKIDENGNPILDPSLYGQVVEIDGQSISARALRLRHAKIVRFRPDKSVESCVITKRFLKDNVV